MSKDLTANIAMTAGGKMNKVASWAHAEDFQDLDDVMLRAMTRAEDLGCGFVSAGTGRLIQVMAAARRAQSVVEVGTGAGVSGLWLLRGMAPDGVLTTIDSEAEHQAAAKAAFVEEGIRPVRTRTITGRAGDVLAKLASGTYDIVVVDADPRDALGHVEASIPLLRHGGLLLIPHALADDAVPDPARRDEVTTAMRELGRTLRADDRLTSAMVGVGDGLLVATVR